MKIRLFVVVPSALLVLACVSSGSNFGVAIAEEGSAVAASSSCPSAAVTLTDPTNGPHWNGWGVDPSQSRFQPADMAQLAQEDVPRLKLKWAFGVPGAVFAPCATDCDRRPNIRWKSVRNGLFARRDNRMHLLAIRCRDGSSLRNHRWPEFGGAGGLFRRSERECPCCRRGDRQSSVEGSDREPSDRARHWRSVTNWNKAVGASFLK